MALRNDPEVYRVEAYHGGSYLDGWRIGVEGLDLAGVAEQWAMFLMGAITGTLVRQEEKICADWWYRMAKGLG